MNNSPNNGVAEPVQLACPILTKFCQACRDTVTQAAMPDLKWMSEAMPVAHCILWQNGKDGRTLDDSTNKSFFNPHTQL